MDSDRSGEEIFGDLVYQGTRRVIHYPAGLVKQYQEADAAVERFVALLSPEDMRRALVAAVKSEVHRRA